MQILFCIGGWRCRFSPAGCRGASLSVSAGYWPLEEAEKEEDYNLEKDIVLRCWLWPVRGARVEPTHALQPFVW